MRSISDAGKRCLLGWAIGHGITGIQQAVFLPTQHGRFHRIQADSRSEIIIVFRHLADNGGDIIADQKIQQFTEVGAVTIDTPLTPQQIAATSAVFDHMLPFHELREGESPRYQVGITCSFDHSQLLDIIQHPFFEDVAKRVLQADAVHFFQTAIVTTYPQPNTPFSFGQHVDIQYRLSDLHAVPRCMVCSYFL